MTYSLPERALVRVPVEEAAAAQLVGAGTPVVSEKDKLVAEFSCAADHELFRVAAARCQVERLDDDTLVADLAFKARRPWDETPYGTEPRRYGRLFLWHEPQILTHTIEPLPPLPGPIYNGDFSLAVAGWLEGCIEAVDPLRLAEATTKWRQQRDVVVATVIARVDEVRNKANREEHGELDDRIYQLRNRVMYKPTQEDMEWDDETGMGYVPSWGWMIDNQIDKIWNLAKRIELAAADRARKAQARGEITRLVSEHEARLPERIRLAARLGLLDESFGAARAALLEILRPGWAFVDDDLKDPVNPPESALEALEYYRQKVPDARLAYRKVGKDDPGSYVVAEEFLGRTAVITAISPRI